MSRVAVVTGGTRGIGAAIAAALSAEGAQVIGVDIPSNREALETTLAPLSGTALAFDIAAPDTPAQLAAALDELGVDIVVHNAGITKDKTIARMSDTAWHSVIDINLSAQERLDDALLAAGVTPTAAEAVTGPLSGQTWVLTGSLTSLTRPQAEDRIRALGGTAGSSVSRRTAAVIVGEPISLNLVLGIVAVFCVIWVAATDRRAR